MNFRIDPKNHHRLSSAPFASMELPQQGGNHSCCREKGSNARPSPYAACSTNGEPRNVINQTSQSLPPFALLAVSKTLMTDTPRANLPTAIELPWLRIRSLWPLFSKPPRLRGFSTELAVRQPDHQGAAVGPAVVRIVPHPHSVPDGASGRFRNVCSCIASPAEARLTH
jgi:hypothetical protein